MGSGQSSDLRRYNDETTINALINNLNSPDFNLLLSSVTRKLHVRAERWGFYHNVVLYSIAWDEARAVSICQLLQSKRMYLPPQETIYDTYSYLQIVSGGWICHAQRPEPGVVGQHYIGHLYPLSLAQFLWLYYPNPGLAVVIAYLSGSLV